MTPVAEEPRPDLSNLPEAVAAAPRRLPVPFVWLIPAVVIIIAAFVVIHAKLAQGPSIEISFRIAEGIEPNKATIRYKDVEIGDVEGIRVSPDRQHVIVTASIHPDASDYLVADTRFWIVRPRVSAGAITGLGTLLSGAYIDVDIGRSTVPLRKFNGLEIPPIVTADQPGKQFVLHAADIGSLNIGSKVYYRHIEAGQVVAYSIDPSGDAVTIKIFINEPYGRFVTDRTRFWQASGIDMTLGSEGVNLHIESLASVLEGGIAFQAVPGEPAARPAARNSTYELYSDAERAMRPADTDIRKFVMFFSGSLRGLSVGAAVDLRGITVGEVKRVYVEFDRDRGDLRFPVEVDIYPQRIRDHYRRGIQPPRAAATPDLDSRALFDRMVARGMRAELKTASLLTAQKYVAMDIHPDVAHETVNWANDPPIFPTVSGSLDELQDSISSIAKKIDRLPFDQMSARLLTTMASLDQTLKSTDRLVQQVDGTIAPQVSETLTQAQAAIKNATQVLGQNAPLQSDLSEALLQVSRAARSVTALVDYLERHPESLLRGKPRDEP